MPIGSVCFLRHGCVTGIKRRWINKVARMALKTTSLVLGGASSGKSLFAERLVIVEDLPRIYIATAQAFDDDMSVKIARHRTRRGNDWQTIEAPEDLPGALGTAPPAAPVLIDCLTLWLTNLLLGGHDIAPRLEALLDALSDRNGPVTIVSNDVSGGVIPETSLGRQFQRIQGETNQRVAAMADLVVLVTAGLPLVLKGELPIK
ncbi:bifunctional adenosylcobinamide kinase/adenosylcobinamide-phosphate guanylyltransferase [Aestuariibius sp. 2305UL40-4]|uniref:bifunctional adenosylcobinamide kinase/adenosylcobinamide-phosphate guanylyltransferase n=1 Tax=Aestuariibius violaceus TaxID=3234132 RepID=UPI00345F0DB2